MSYTCYLSLGANLGQREASIIEAMRLLQASEKIQLIAVSSLYETPPWGKLDQPAFINAAAAVKTELAPLELLQICQSIEKQLGRQRHEHWGARTIDVDMLYIPGVTMDEEALKLPHPYMLQRSFVLVPLAEVAGDMVIAGKNVKEHMLALGDRETILNVRPAQSVAEELKL
ncbi:MAG: 2-amino-4-hydroxy-6-hydroxymethyldihydropteridine diphosphokinase [Selenomonadaceae bacterium]|nr:2-amino-4-hydroxy-6-hydroxymethyldihydropteridine diphosphokinase [Selenomonadaceae bacterium]